jgi:hypothetical protein
MKPRGYYIPSIHLALAWGRATRRRVRCEDSCRPEVRGFRFWGRGYRVLSRTAAKLAGIMRKRALG